MMAEVEKLSYAVALRLDMLQPVSHHWESALSLVIRQPNTTTPYALWDAVDRIWVAAGTLHGVHCRDAMRC